MEASTFSARWRGLRRRPGRFGLLIETRSVHTIGMPAPIWVVPIDPGGVVLCVKRLEPGRLFFRRQARWVLELPIGRVPPRTGVRLERS